MEHFADRLQAAISAKGAPVCVGIDPVFERLPDALGDDPVRAIADFSSGVLHAVAEHVPAVKVQIACYERYGSAGYAAYERVVREAASLDLIVIADAKRGDIGVSAAHYAAGLIKDADALTVNTYLGADALAPFIEAAARLGKGLFALVRTSNPGGDAIQNLKLADDRSVGEAVADLVAGVGAAHVGASGYSLLGAVVGATKTGDITSLRARMRRQVFLVPGFGAQGGAAEDVKACFNPDGRGALITASRSVIFAYENADSSDWRQAVADAAGDFKRQIANVLT